MEKLPKQPHFKEWEVTPGITPPLFVALRLFFFFFKDTHSFRLLSAAWISAFSGCHTLKQSKGQNDRGRLFILGNTVVWGHTQITELLQIELSLSASLLSRNHSIGPTACVTSSTSIGGIYVFQENNPPLLCRSPPAGRELKEEKKTKNTLGGW